MHQMCTGTWKNRISISVKINHWKKREVCVGWGKQIQCRLGSREWDWIGWCKLTTTPITIIIINGHFYLLYHQHLSGTHRKRSQIRTINAVRISDAQLDIKWRKKNRKNSMFVGTFFSGLARKIFILFEKQDHPTDQLKHTYTHI